jgi:hypothetical protein
MKYLFVFLALTFYVCSASGQDIMVLKSSGKVIIGDTSQITTPGSYNLYVQNGMMTERVKVAIKSAADWSDDAFDKTPELGVVKQSIESKSHLHNMPSANQLVKEGYELQAMDAKILEQVEWLWQHTIKLSEENKALKAELTKIKEQLAKED